MRTGKELYFLIANMSAKLEAEEKHQIQLATYITCKWSWWTSQLCFFSAIQKLLTFSISLGAMTSDAVDHITQSKQV